MNRKRPMPDQGLGPPVRPFNETFSASTVLKETWFPHLLTEKEKQQIGPKRAAAATEVAEANAADRIAARVKAEQDERIEDLERLVDLQADNLLGMRRLIWSMANAKGGAIRVPYETMQNFDPDTSYLEREEDWRNKAIIINARTKP